MKIYLYTRDVDGRVSDAGHTAATHHMATWPQWPQWPRRSRRATRDDRRHGRRMSAADDQTS